MKITKVRYGATIFRIGDEVRVKGSKTVAKIESFYDFILGGVYLDRAIGDFHSWNVDELVKVSEL